jgi:hypothetical protein
MFGKRFHHGADTAIGKKTNISTSGNHDNSVVNKGILVRLGINPRQLLPYFFVDREFFHAVDYSLMANVFHPASAHFGRSSPMVVAITSAV